MRVIAPVFRIPFFNWWIITRYDHVKEVLATDEIFLSTLNSKIRELSTGEFRESRPGDSLADEDGVFALGLDSAGHTRSLRQIMGTFKLSDASDLSEMSARMARGLIEGHLAAVKEGRANEFDVIQDFVTRVPTLICREYFGIDVPVEDEKSFGDWCVDMSTYVFAPSPNETYREAAVAGARRIRSLIEKSVAQAGAQPARYADTIVGRLVNQQLKGSLSAVSVETLVLGMIMGFVPTVTMAAGDVLDALVGKGLFRSFRRSKFSGPTLKALREGDDVRFARCLRETLRFKPINPGPFRYTLKSYTFDNAGWFGRGAATIPAQSKVLASTQSAMFDRRRVANSYRFDESRTASDSLVFGSGVHACLGIFVATAQIPPAFRVLFAYDLERLSRVMERRGPFPAHLLVKVGPKKA